MFLLISAVTGVLLALKKDVPFLQPPTQKGESIELAAWKPIAELSTIATHALHQQYPEQSANTVHRIDVRPSKGIAKVLFKNGTWEVQVDGVSGEVKSIAKRHADWIESLHDGSIVSDVFKLISMNILGIGLFIMVLTGLWLWYGPKRYRQIKRQKKLPSEAEAKE